MLGYTALAVGDLTLSLRDGELADALWVSRDELRAGVAAAAAAGVDRAPDHHRLDRRRLITAR